MRDWSDIQGHIQIKQDLRQLLAEKLIGLLPQPALGAAQASQVDGIDHAFHRDVAGQIPIAFLPVPAGKEVVKEAVKQQVDIAPLQGDGSSPVLF